MLGLVADGHVLATTCVNLAEVEAGLRRASAVSGGLARPASLPGRRPRAVHRAGRYQAEWASRGRTIQTPDALVAGTARARGAVLLTHNTDDFPMGDLRVDHPGHLDA